MFKQICAFLVLTLCTSLAFAEQYGWVDISNNLPVSNGTASLSDMYWITDNEGWICSGALGEIYHTTNGGKTFELQTTQFYTNAIWMLNATEGYSGGKDGRVYRTTNGGETWNVLGSIGGTLLSICFPPASTTGYCCGDMGRIYSITSTGVSAMNTGLSSNMSSISFPTISQGWACGGSIAVHYSNDSWITDQVYPSGIYNTIYMLSNNKGWTTGDNGVIIKTTDGINWDYQTNPDTSNRTLNDVFFINENEGWTVGNGGVILHTANGGDIWSIEASGMTTNMLRSVQFTSPTNGYVLGNKGTLLHYTRLTDVEAQSNKPSGFSLEQNYPNPFNPLTNIDFSIPTSQKVTLKVFDLLGREVATIADDEYSAGRHTVEFKSNNLASGVYFYKIFTGNYTAAKKLILVR